MSHRRRIFGNLDCESEFAASYRRPGDAGTFSPRLALSPAAAAHAAALATLLRAFAVDGDRLWTPAAVAPKRVAEVPGLPRPELETGPPAALPAAGRLLAWGETETAAALRRNVGSAGVSPTSSRWQTAKESRRDAGAPSLHELVWRLPAAKTEVAAKVHHRSFAHEVAADLGCALPGAAMVASMEDLEQRRRGVDGGAWVIKAPFSAAGRSRHVVRGEPTAADRRRVERLLDRHRELLFEPWLDRRDDFGIAGAITAVGVRKIGVHRSFTAPRGAFLGVELGTSVAGAHDLDDGEHRQLEAVFDGVSQALIGAGYRGPFGIDCWRYRLPSGEPAFHPLGEINARMTLGMVARALVDRVRKPLGIERDATVRLRWGAEDPPAGAIALLHRDRSPRSLAAWLESPEHSTCE